MIRTLLMYYIVDRCISMLFNDFAMSLLGDSNCIVMYGGLYIMCMGCMMHIVGMICMFRYYLIEWI